MAIYELRKIYGNKKGSQLVNAAIRAELPGGAAVLDAIRVASQVISDASPGTAKAARELYDLLKNAQADMAEQIAKKYDFKTIREKERGNEDENNIEK